MVGLLYALPNTQLTRRLEREGRLHPATIWRRPSAPISARTASTSIRSRPLRDILTDYKRVLEHIYSPAAYAGASTA